MINLLFFFIIDRNGNYTIPSNVQSSSYRSDRSSFATSRGDYRYYNNYKYHNDKYSSHNNNHHNHNNNQQQSTPVAPYSYKRKSYTNISARFNGTGNGGNNNYNNRPNGIGRTSSFAKSTSDNNDKENINTTTKPLFNEGNIQLFMLWINKKLMSFKIILITFCFLYR